MSENAEMEKYILDKFKEMTEAMQDIKFICNRAQAHYIEEKDIEDIKRIVKKFA